MLRLNSKSSIFQLVILPTAPPCETRHYCLLHCIVLHWLKIKIIWYIVIVSTILHGATHCFRESDECDSNSQSAMLQSKYVQTRIIVIIFIVIMIFCICNWIHNAKLRDRLEDSIMAQHRPRQGPDLIYCDVSKRWVYRFTKLQSETIRKRKYKLLFIVNSLLCI